MRAGEPALPLAALQRGFAQALLHEAGTVPQGVTSHTAPRPAKRFQVYRNNVFASLIEVVRARFPAVERLVGEEFFRAMARLFVEAHPPRSPVLLDYGGDFAAFLRGFPPAAELPWLADVAEIEWLCNRACHAPDAIPLEAAALAAIAPEHLGGLRFTLHPSARLFASGYPAVSIWEANTGDRDGSLSGDLGAEAALILRPALEVMVLRLAPGAHAFTEALAAGMPLGAAAALAAEADPAFALPEALGALLAAGALSDLTLSLPDGD